MLTANPQPASQTTKVDQVLSEDQLLDTLTEELEALAALLSEIVIDTPPLATPFATMDINNGHQQWTWRGKALSIPIQQMPVHPLITVVPVQFHGPSVKELVYTQGNLCFIHTAPRCSWNAAPTTPGSASLIEKNAKKRR